jgi:ribosomal-protein-alanine N-acetyltransferase
MSDDFARLQGARCRLRPYATADIPHLARLANDRLVTRWMTARFPYPYTLSDAENWIAKAVLEHPVNTFVIEVEGAFAGSVAILPHDGEGRGIAEFGYWLGREFWGRGIAAEAARILADFALTTRELRRLEARVWEPNIASVRVLESAGFVREATLRSGVVDREGTVSNLLIFGRLATDSSPLDRS